MNIKKEKKLETSIGPLWILLKQDKTGYEVSVETEKKQLHLTRFKDSYNKALLYFTIIEKQITIEIINDTCSPVIN